MVCRQTNAVSTERVDRFAIAAELLLLIFGAHFLITQGLARIDSRQPIHAIHAVYSPGMVNVALTSMNDEDLK